LTQNIRLCSRADYDANQTQCTSNSSGKQWNPVAHVYFRIVGVGLMTFTHDAPEGPVEAAPALQRRFAAFRTRCS